ncbi:hypothetical protein BVRB_6g146600 [Beta vulgaris subsp. vulgaris]|nr:hypothetical protein BVRB_6g146600 [Beta vulgaris subsp. vulgaris]
MSFLNVILCVAINVLFHIFTAVILVPLQHCCVRTLNILLLLHLVQWRKHMREIDAIPRDSRRDKGKRVEEDDHEEEASLQQRVKYVDSTKDRTQSRGDSRDGGKQHKPLKCFLCDGPHMARACPTRQKLSAIIATLGEESATEASMGAMRLGEEAQLANIRLLNASEVVEEEPIREASTTTTGTGIKPGGSLMVVNGTVNEVHTRVLVDTGATHNFLALREAKNLGVKFTKVDGEMKAINSGATPVYGRAWNVPVRLGKWRGKIDFLVVDMDDESIVLGMEFLDSVMPIKMGDGVLTITNKGSECDIHLAKGKDADNTCFCINGPVVCTIKSTAVTYS